MAELDDFARRQWEGVLGYMVGSASDEMDDGIRRVRAASLHVSHGVKTLLEIGKLVQLRARGVEITQNGFTFILQEVNAQVWTMLILYLQNAETVCCRQSALRPSANYKISSTWTTLMSSLSSSCLAPSNLASPTPKPTSQKLKPKCYKI